MRFVLVSVEQEVWIHSLHLEHSTDPRLFSWLVIRFEQMGQMYNVCGPGLLSVSDYEYEKGCASRICESLQCKNNVIV